MKKTEFYVKTDQILHVANILGNNQIINQILGVTNENELIIYVEYFAKDRAVITDLQSTCEYYNYENEEIGLDNVIGDDDLDDNFMDISQMN